MSMNYAELFDQFWERRYHTLQINNPQRTYENIRARLEECEGTKDIDRYVCTLTNGKETNRRIIVEFYDYLREKHQMPIESGLYDMRFYNSPLERQLEIAKYLHKPRTLADIEKHFGISEETRKQDIRALENGIEFLGSSIRITKVREEGRIRYKSTMHPVFLPLNLTEIYAMTVYLDRVLDPRDPNAQIIRDIISRVKYQLSDYARDKFSFYSKEEYAKNDYYDDECLARQRKGIRMYLMKSGQPCRFHWNGQEHTGRIKCIAGREFIELEDGRELDADPREVDFIIDSLEYK